MRFDSLISSLILTTCTFALACSDDGKSDVGDEAETSSEGDGDGDTSESESESTDDVDTSSDDIDTSTDAETTADTETDDETTDTETTDTETTDETDTSPLGCNEIEAEYEALVTMTDCDADDQCKIIQGHCGVGLGGCDYAVNVGVSETALDELADAYTDANCTNGVCDCAAPPASAVCMDGACVGVD
jgi:hypothetical protein